MRYFQIKSLRYDVPRKWRGKYQARHPWFLPGVECPTCGETWSGHAAYSAVDLSQMDAADALKDARVEPYAEYERLAQQVLPLLPAGVVPEPGMQFGPLRGTARGSFGPVTAQAPWEVVLREDAVDRLRGAGLRGAETVRAELRGLSAGALPLFELAPPRSGRMHQDCILEGGPPCRTCGWRSVRLHPDGWLDAEALPKDLDVFRLSNAETWIVVSERFVDSVNGLEASDVVYQELGIGQPLKPPSAGR